MIENEKLHENIARKLSELTERTKEDKNMGWSHTDPEYIEEKPVCHCSHCGEPIYEGDWMWNIHGEYFCEDCINDLKESA